MKENIDWCHKDSLTIKTISNKEQLYDEFYDDSTGYTYIKIGEPNKWIKKQRYIYEKYHGKIPDGYSIMFRNQNKQDFDIDNLMLVKNRDKLVMKNLHLCSSNKYITDTGLLIAQVINKTSDIRNKMKGVV